MTRPASLRLALLALLGLTLAACDAVASLSGPTHQYVLQADMEAAGSEAEDGENAEDVVERSMDVVNRRLDALGVYVHETSFLGDGRVMIRTSGDDNSEALYASAGTRGELVMRMVDETVRPDQLEMGIAPAGSEVLETSDGYERLAVKRIGGIRGERITNARPGLDAMTNDPIVSIEFDEQGGKDFAILSSENVGRRFAIILDDAVLSAPIFNEPILGGQAQISGGFTYEEAEQLAAMLQAGALPVTFEVLEERTVY